MKAIRRIAVGGVVAVAISALATLPVSAQTSPATGPTTDLPKIVKVKVGDNYFKPKKLTIVVGDRVNFVWIGTAIHDVKVKKGPQKFESDKQASGKFKQVVLEPGKYKIVCTLHPGMEMKMTAKEPPPVTTSTAPLPAP
ncbi:MAG: hypothetical protein EXQ79_04335 [Acidimicrobiia bacterium]|nr:hypothetical protein [Acidimicrobiia bacterium]